MLQVSYTDKQDAPGPNQKVVRVKTSDGRIEDVVVHESLLTNGSLCVAGVSQREDKVLIELPAESTAGNWRIWVDKKLVHG